jgi:hypothetical protein
MPRGIITDANITGNVNVFDQIRAGGSTGLGQLSVTPINAATIGAVIRGAASQSAHLLQLQDSSGTVLSGVSASGRIYTGTAPLTNSGAQAANISALADAATVTPLVVRGAASQSANLLELQRADAGVAFRVRNNGNFGSGGLVTGVNAYINNDIIGDTKGLIVRGASGQTNNLQEWQNSGGTVLARVTSSGSLVTTQGFAVLGGASISGSIATLLQTSNAARIALVVQGAASQSANLQEWQNSGGTVLARVDSGGNFKATNVATLNSTGQMTEANSGALFVMGRATAQASSPGLNFGTLYFRDGTTAGTLRLATRTGAAGVEETIVDNISSTGSTAGARFTGAGGVNTTGGLTLSGANSPINLNGSLGTSGQVLTSSGAGTTPTWTTVGGTFTGGTLTSDLILAAGSTTVEPIRFQTNTSTPVATSGALDYDGDKFYAVTSGTATGRLMVPAIARVFSNANATAATTNSSQSIFQAGARALTLEAAKTYYFRLNLGVNFTFSAVPAAIQLVPTFTQTPVAINYSAVWASGTSGGVQSFRTTSTAAVSISPSLSASVTGGTILIEGFFQSNATTGGTVEFKYQISTGGGSSATAQTGTLLEIEKIGTGTPGIISGAWA